MTQLGWLGCKTSTQTNKQTNMSECTTKLTIGCATRSALDASQTSDQGLRIGPLLCPLHSFMDIDHEIYGHSPSPADTRRAVVIVWWKYVHSTGSPLRRLSLLSKDPWVDWAVKPQHKHIRTVWLVSLLIACAIYSLGTIQRRLNENLCHTGWMYRLIWVFAGCTGLL